MVKISEILNNPDLLYKFGWSVTLICVAISVWVARRFLEHNSRLYSAMALFACCWMLVLGTYSLQRLPSLPRDIADSMRQLASLPSDIAAVLLVYIGGLLAGDARARREHHPAGVTWVQKLALGLLFSVAVPTAIPGPFGIIIQPIFSLFEVENVPGRQIGIAVSATLVLAGFASLARGTRDICVGIHGTKLYSMLLIILICYAIVSSARSFDIWSDPDWHPMGAFFLLPLAAAKLALTIVFSIIIIKYARAEPAQVVT